MKVISESEVAQSCPTLSDPMDQSPLSMGFSRQKYWSGSPFASPGDLPNPGMEPRSPMSPALQVNSLLLGPRLRYTNSNPKNSGINIVVKGENKILYRMSASC